MKTNWITFYSYKGGVGRTMALANVAASLVARGRRVVLIDFDLEAPGLDRFPAFKKSVNMPGVVEYVHRFLADKSSPDISSFVHSCNLNFPTIGQLWLMPSGKQDQSYMERLHSIPWREMFDAGVAEPFIDDWKRSIEEEYQPDFVFIDSRTGFTDVGGLCTLQFPDMVVLMFALNEQNLQGIAAVRKTVASYTAREPIQVITVASPIPNIARGPKDLLTAKIDKVQTALGSKINAFIHYFPSLALEERLWTLEAAYPEPRISEDYAELTETILSKLRDGFDFVLRSIDGIEEKSDRIAAAAVIKELEKHYSDRSEAHQAIARLQRMLGHKKAAEKALLMALKIEPNEEHYQKLASQLLADQNFDDLRRITDDCWMAVRDDPEQSWDLARAVGQTYMQLGLYRQAAEVYELAAADEPDDLVACFNFAEANRRHIGAIQLPEWRHVISLLGKNWRPDITEVDDSPTTQANRLQALHVAFAVTDDLATATQCLAISKAIASTLNPSAQIFSLHSFVEIPKAAFLSELEAMAEAIGKGKLWDGMDLKRRRSH